VSGDLAFENGQPVLTVEPEVYAEPEADEPTEAAETLRRFIRWLLEGGSVRGAGQRAFLLGHLVGECGFETDAALAEKLKISAGRLSQLRADLTDDFPALGRCHRRQN
jgi:hypothetical protein